MTLREFIDKKQQGGMIDVECWYKYVIQRQIAWCLIANAFANGKGREEINLSKCKGEIEERWKELLTTDVNEAFKKIGFNEVEDDDLS